MSNDIVGGLKNLISGPLDSLEGPYDSIASACASIPNVVDSEGKNFRIGKKAIVNVSGKLVAYWWPNGVYGDADIVPVVDLSGYVSKSSDIVNDLTTGGVTKALSAEQGKIINNSVIKSIRKQISPVIFSSQSKINTSGLLVNWGSGNVTDYMPAENVAAIQLTLFSAVTDSIVISFYDSNKIYIPSGSYISNGSAHTIADTGIITVPVSAAYYKLCWDSTGNKPNVYTYSSQ